MVDVDPQGAIGLSLSKRMSQGPGLSEWLTGQPLDELLLPTRLKELALLPVGRVRATESQRFQSLLEDGRRLASLVARLSSSFELIIIDTPSGFVGATLGALRASRWVLTPVQSEPIAARTLIRCLEAITALKEEGNHVELAGVLITMLQRSDRASAAIANDLWRTVPERLMLESCVPRDPALLEASNAGVPLGLLRRRPPPLTSEFDRLAAELEDRMGLGGPEKDDVPIALVD